jgi:uncharacterized membrane protein YkoI
MQSRLSVFGTAAAMLIAGGFLTSSPASAQVQPPVGITWEQAHAAALSAVPGTIVESEQEWVGGTAAFEVGIRPQEGGPIRVVLIDASTGALVNESLPAALSWQQAQDAALSVVQGTVLEIEMKRWRGTVAYEVEVRPQSGGRARELLIDASNGTVLRNRLD